MPKPGASRRGHAGGAATRLQLIETAEALFADHGLDGVSLRQVAAAAGQRNTRAAQYHFGSKDDLVRAILVHRLEEIEVRRRQLLQELEDQGRAGDVRALVSVLVVPLVEADDPDGTYVRFLDRLGHAEGEHPYNTLDGDVTAGARRAQSLLLDALASVPLDRRQERLTLAFRLSTAGMAAIHRRTHPGSREREVALHELIDAMTAVLTTPPSDETTAALARG